MSDIKITKHGLELRDMMPTAVVDTIQAIQREEGMTVTKAVGTAYTRGVTEPEAYPECVEAVQWLRASVTEHGAEKTWLAIHHRVKD